MEHQAVGTPCFVVHHEYRSGHFTIRQQRQEAALCMRVKMASIRVVEKTDEDEAK